MLKCEFIKIYETIMQDNNFTYSDMQELTKLSSSQLACILKHGAKGISIEKMENGINNLGFGIEITPFRIEEE